MRLVDGVMLWLSLFTVVLFLGGVFEGIGGEGLVAGVGSFAASSVGDTRAGRASPLDQKRVPSAVFNVKRFGALANGRNDDRKGHLKASTNLSQYGSDAGWVEFGWVEGLSLTGGGVFDGRGAKAWQYDNCLVNVDCKLLPTNIKFISMNKTSVRGITSLNSKSFHIALVECDSFRGSEITISAPADSPNTDGIHIE